eukprot:gene1950-2279_t
MASSSAFSSSKVDGSAPYDGSKGAKFIEFRHFHQPRQQKERNEAYRKDKDVHSGSEIEQLALSCVPNGPAQRLIRHIREYAGPEVTAAQNNWFTMLETPPKLHELLAEQHPSSVDVRGMVAQLIERTYRPLYEAAKRQGIAVLSWQQMEIIVEFDMTPDTYRLFYQQQQTAVVPAPLAPVGETSAGMGTGATSTGHEGLPPAVDAATTAGADELKLFYSFNKPGAQGTMTVEQLAQHLALLYESVQFSGDVKPNSALLIFKTALNSADSRAYAHNLFSLRKDITLDEMAREIQKHEQDMRDVETINRTAQ